MHRVFVATWNVGGRSPSSHLNLEDWLHTSPAADIYVIGYNPDSCSDLNHIVFSLQNIVHLKKI